MPSDLGLSRRSILQVLAGGAAMAAGIAPGAAGEERIGTLIEQARALPTIAKRVEFISRSLLGARYRGFTLIGGPRRREKFVVRDDGFDCVTYCETVLAAAIAKNIGEFEVSLKAIRYHNGIVDWRQRNHYFFEWGQHNVENKTCRAIAMDGAVALEKTVYWHRALGRRRFSMSGIPRETLLANKQQLAAGDIIGFITQRPNLDYFHVGFVAFGKGGELLLRHASLSRHRVLDEDMEEFLTANHVRYVTLLRPQEPGKVALSFCHGRACPGHPA